MKKKPKNICTSCNNKYTCVHCSKKLCRKYHYKIIKTQEEVQAILDLNLSQKVYSYFATMIATPYKKGYIECGSEGHYLQPKGRYCHECIHVLPVRGIAKPKVTKVKRSPVIIRKPVIARTPV